MAITGYWKFNEAAGNAADSSGNGFTLTNAGAGYAAGKLGNCSTYGATNMNITTETESWNFGTGNFTIAFWMKTASGGNKGILIDANTWMTAGCWGVIIYGHKIYAQDSGGLWMQSIATVDDNNWHRIVIVKEGTGANQIKLYIDGNTTPDAVGTSNLNLNGAQRLQVGGQVNTYTTGIDNIDDLQIHKGTAWTTDDIISDWGDGGAGTEWPWGGGGSSNKTVCCMNTGTGLG